MRKTGRFDKRKGQLDAALGVPSLESLWSRRVRGSLRSQPLSDLHDYYDFHRNRRSRLRALREAVLDGRYQPQPPVRVRSEKALGLSRHLVFLGPEDALVLEAVADFLYPIVKAKAPTKRAYFSRNRGMPKAPQDVDDSFGYAWWELWPQFQSRIMEFSRRRKVTVVTDVATYFDTIEFDKLRNFLAGLGLTEVFLDFLFFLFERFVWRPDYLPYPGRGVPQIDLDAPRLVAHAFLYEVDELLESRTGGDFVRWLDDIDFGCDSDEAARELLRDIDELLLSRGLHLNSSKTRILDSKSAFGHFQLRENRYLTVLGNRIRREASSGGLVSRESSRRLRRRFRDFAGRPADGQWKKVYKRYFTLATHAQDPFLESTVPDLLCHEPSLRPSIFRYYQELGWSPLRETHVVGYLRSTLDDVGYGAAIDVLMNWRPLATIPYMLRMRALAAELATTDPMRFLGSLRLLAKFGSARQLDEYIRQYLVVWRAEPWLARQVVCLWPRFPEKKTRDLIRGVLGAYGLTTAYSVLLSYAELDASKPATSKTIMPYLTAPSTGGVFPIAKVLASLAAIETTRVPTARATLVAALLSEHRDPVYRWHVARRR